MAALSFRRVDEVGTLQKLVEDVFADPQVRWGLGWTDEDDPEEAMAAIEALFEHRHEAGWTLLEVRHGGRCAGLAGLGPLDPESAERAYAIYLTERRRGLGRRVTDRLLERARASGAESVLAITWAENEASRALLEGAGFRFEGEAPYGWAQESELDWVVYRCVL